MEDFTWQHKTKSDTDWTDYPRGHSDQLTHAYIQGTEEVRLKAGSQEWRVNLKSMKQEPKRQPLFLYKWRMVRCVGANGICWPPLDVKTSSDERAKMTTAAAAEPSELPDASSTRGAATLIDAIEQRFQDLPLAFQHVPTWPNIEEMLIQAPGNIMAFQRHLHSARFLIHRSVLPLLNSFIRFKCAFGTLAEFKIYRGMGVTELVDRLVGKRPVVFRGQDDSFVLSDQCTGKGGFEQVATGKFRWPIQNVISYDEMALSPLISVGGLTQFLNAGKLGNKGLYDPGRHINEAVCVGCAGPRFERRGQMEWRHILITKEQNTRANGYGLTMATEDFSSRGKAARAMLKAWAKLYRVDHFPLYSELQNIDPHSERFALFLAPQSLSIRTVHPIYFDRKVYRARMRLVVEPFLCFADQQARLFGTTAFVRAMVLPVETWCAVGAQTIMEEEQVLAYAEVLEERAFPNISDLIILECTKVSVGALAALTHIGDRRGVNVNFRPRAEETQVHSAPGFAAPFGGKDIGKLLVCMRPENGVSAPGNQYWTANFDGEEASMVSCCTVPLVHNVAINHELRADKALLPLPPLSRHPNPFTVFRAASTKFKSLGESSDPIVWLASHQPHRWQHRSARESEWTDCRVEHAKQLTEAVKQQKKSITLLWGDQTYEVDLIKFTQIKNGLRVKERFIRCVGRSLDPPQEYALLALPPGFMPTRGAHEDWTKRPLRGRDLLSSRVMGPLSLRNAVVDGHADQLMRRHSGVYVSAPAHGVESESGGKGDVELRFWHAVALPRTDMAPSAFATTKVHASVRCLVQLYASLINADTAAMHAAWRGRAPPAMQVQTLFHTQDPPRVQLQQGPQFLEFTLTKNTMPSAAKTAGDPASIWRLTDTSSPSNAKLSRAVFHTPDASSLEVMAPLLQRAAARFGQSLRRVGALALGLSANGDQTPVPMDFETAALVFSSNRDELLPGDNAEAVLMIDYDSELSPKGVDVDLARLPKLCTVILDCLRMGVPVVVFTEYSVLGSLWRVLALCADAATAHALQHLVLVAHGGTIAYRFSIVDTSKPRRDLSQRRNTVAVSVTQSVPNISRSHSTSTSSLSRSHSTSTGSVGGPPLAPSLRRAHSTPTDSALAPSLQRAHSFTSSSFFTKFDDQQPLLGGTPKSDRCCVRAQRVEEWAAWSAALLTGTRDIQFRDLSPHLLCLRAGPDGLWRVHDGESPVQQPPSVTRSKVQDFCEDHSLKPDCFLELIGRT